MLSSRAFLTVRGRRRYELFSTVVYDEIYTERLFKR